MRENGYESSGPRQAFENAFRLGWIDDEYLVDDLLKSRSTAIHVYPEELARELASRLPAFHAALSAVVQAAHRDATSG